MADEKLHPEVEALIESVREKWEGSERLVRIALLAASKAREEEREECARVCMRRMDARWAEHSIVEPDTNAAYYPKSVAWMETADEEAEDCAAAIRRRGKP